MAAKRRHHFALSPDSIPLPVIVHRVSDGAIMHINAAARQLLMLRGKKNSTLTFAALWTDAPTLPLHRRKTPAQYGPFTRTRAGRTETYAVTRQYVRADGVACYVDVLQATPSSDENAKPANDDPSTTIHAAGLSETLMFGRMGSVELDLDTHRVRLSPELLHLLDVSRQAPKETSLEKFLQAYVSPEYHELIGKKILEGANGRHGEGSKSVTATFEMTTSSGRRIWVEAKGFFRGNTAVGIFQDVTDRRHAEEQISTTNHLANAIINSLPGIFYLFDDTGRFLRWNKNFERVSGYTASEIETMIPLDFFDADEKPVVMQRIQRVFETGASEVEANFFTKDGRKIPHYFNGCAVDFEGKRCLIGMGVDITSRIEAEHQSGAKARLIQNLLSGITDGFLATDRELNFTLANHAFGHLVSMAERDIVGRNMLDLFPFMEGTDYLMRYRQALATGESFSMEARNLLNPHQILQIHAYPNSTGGFTYFRDITARKLEERRLREFENRLKAFFESTSDSIMIFDHNGVLLDFNHVADDLSMSVHNVRLYHGQPMNEVVIDGSFSALLPIVQAALNGQSAEHENELTYRDGTKVWWRFRFIPIRDGDHIIAIALNGSNIDALMQASQRVMKSENELRAIIDASAYATILLDRNGRIQNFNAFARENMRRFWSHDIAEGDDFSQTLPAFFQHDFASQFARALTGEKVLVEREVLNVSAQKRWLEFVYLPVFGPNREVIGVTFNATDLTQQKEAEAQYRKSTEQMRFAARLAKFGEWEFDLKTRRSRWSDEVCRIHGVVPGYQPGLDEALNFYTDDSRPLLATALQKCIDDGSWYDLTLQIVSRTGRKKWIRTVGVSERIGDRAVKLYGLFQDIDDMRQKQEESARLALIAKKTDNLVVITGADRKIQWVNESFTRTTGYTLREVIGRSPGEVLQGPETQPDTVAYVRDKLDRKEPVTFEIVNYTKSGEKYWLDIEIQPVFGAAGELDYFIGIQSNITDRKLTEESLRQSRRGLEESLKEKESLIKEIHHRVKNNLQLISSILYLKMSGMQQSDMRDFLGDTRQKIRSIALIHERLLQSGSMHQVDIADYLSKLILDIQMTLVAQTPQLNIEAHIEPAQIGLDVAIHCGLILNELILNAIKHAFPDRREGTVYITFDVREGRCTFIVADDGVGLSPDIGPGKGGFGMQLLDVFFRQLKAEVTISRDEGTRYLIAF